MAKKEAVFPEKERARIRVPQRTPIENRIFQQKTAKWWKHSSGEQVKTRRGVERGAPFFIPLSPRRNSLLALFWGLARTKPYAPSITPASVGKPCARPPAKRKKLRKKHSPSPGGWWAGWVGGGWLVGWLAGWLGWLVAGWLGRKDWFRLL